MKILYLSTIIGTIDSFFIPYFKLFSQKGYVVDAAGNFTAQISDDLINTTRKIYNFPMQRNPLSFKNIIALKKILRLLKANDYDFVHVHTPVASVLGRLACAFTSTKCFYTAHGFHFYKGAPLLNWLIYFPIEWFLSFFTDTLITINTEDYELAKKYLHAKRTVYIPGVGIDVDKFANARIDVKAKRKELGIPEDCKLILSVGELNKNKNQQVVIRALSLLNEPQIHFAICGVGVMRNYLIKLAKELNVNDRLHLLGRRDDIHEILKCADLFVHSSFREGLPVSVLEALASGLPYIVSCIRGNKDLVVSKNKIGIIADNFKVQTYAKLIRSMLEKKNDCNDILINRDNFKEKFDIKNVINLIVELYNNVESYKND